MYDIFISYAREDLTRVEPIVNELLKLGWRVFIDRNILPGSNWSSSIIKALEETRCVLVVWTFSSVDTEKHPFVRDEAASGLKRGILVPLRLDGVDPPLGFGSFQIADLSDWNNNSAHPEFMRCVEAACAIVKAEFKTIMDLLNNPAKIEDALLLAKKLPFRGYDEALFEQLRRAYNKDEPDFELVGVIRSFLSDYDPEQTTKESQAENHSEYQMTHWHHLDKKKMKMVFKRLWNKKKMVNVFFIERNPEAYAHYLHIILQKFYERTFETVCVVKMDLEYPFDIADAEGEFAHFIHRFFDINVALMRNSESVQSRIFDTQVHFVGHSIDDFSYANFRKYYELWVALEPKKPLFLFFYVQPGSLADDIDPLENYCLCRYDDHEKVDGEAFQDFFSDPKSPLKNNNPDICNSPPMTFQKAVKELEFCLKEP